MTLTIGLYTLFNEGLLLAYGSYTLLFVMLSIINFLLFSDGIGLPLFSSLLFGTLPVMFALYVVTINLSWGFGVLIIIEAMYIVLALVELNKK